MSQANMSIVVGPSQAQKLPKTRVRLPEFAPLKKVRLKTDCVIPINRLKIFSRRQRLFSTYDGQLEVLNLFLAFS
jgi:hypothetical protein